MATKETTPDSLARKAFIITMMGAALYITVVFTFVIGGNRREEAAAAAKSGNAAPAAEHAPQHEGSAP